MIHLLALLVILIPAHVYAVTLEWPCNVEPDVKDYRVEYAAEPSYAWGVVSTIEHIAGCESMRYPDTRYISPGRKRYRVFTGNDDGHYSTPSPEAWITIPISPIGNPGGQSEASLPPSPHTGDVVVPPVEPPPVPVVTLKEAIQQGLSTCLTRKLAHTACMKALNEALGKVNP